MRHCNEARLAARVNHTIYGAMQGSTQYMELIWFIAIDGLWWRYPTFSVDSSPWVIRGNRSEAERLSYDHYIGGTGP